MAKRKPSSRRPQPNRKKQKRDEFWQRGANLVEIDLLRAGRPTLRVTSQQLDSLRPGGTWSP